MMNYGTSFDSCWFRCEIVDCVHQHKLFSGRFVRSANDAGNTKEQHEVEKQHQFAVTVLYLGKRGEYSEKFAKVVCSKYRTTK